MSIVVQYVACCLLSKHPIDQATPPSDIDLVLWEKERERERKRVLQCKTEPFCRSLVSRIQLARSLPFQKTISVKCVAITMPRVYRLSLSLSFIFYFSPFPSSTRFGWVYFAPDFQRAIALSRGSSLNVPTESQSRTIFETLGGGGKNFYHDPRE